MSAKILIVDDDLDFLKFAQAVLEGEGRLVCPCSSVDSARRWLIQPGRPSLILLDVRFHGQDRLGIEFCRELKGDVRTRSIPIVLLSAGADNRLRIDAGLAQSDLVLNKPIEAQELSGAVATVLQGPKKSGRGLIRKGEFEISPEEKTVLYKEKRLPDLGPSLFELFYLLAEHAPNAVSRSFALSSLRMDHRRDREIDVLVSRLRKKLRGTIRYDIIQTVPGEGYRLLLQNLP